MCKVRFSKDISIRLAIFAIGFSPIVSLALAVFGVVPLHLGGRWIVLPAILIALALGFVFHEYTGVLLRGLLLGIAAVFIYDLICRFPFIAIGVWRDFIPRIGDQLLNRENVHWSVGYLWRYLGNGGGMGLAFYAAYPLVRQRVKPLKAGVIYGLGIFCCLLATIYLAPAGKSYLFAPTPATAMLGLLGHIIYGTVLGYGTKQSLSLVLEQTSPLFARHGCVSCDTEVGGDVLLAAHANQGSGDSQG